MSKFNIHLIKIEKIREMIEVLRSIEEAASVDDIINQLFDNQKKPATYQIHFLTEKTLTWAYNAGYTCITDKVFDAFENRVKKVMKENVEKYNSIQEAEFSNKQKKYFAGMLRDFGLKVSDEVLEITDEKPGAVKAVKADLLFQMNSLTKLKVDKDYSKICKWIGIHKWTDEESQEDKLFASAKLDGVSIQVIITLNANSLQVQLVTKDRSCKSGTDVSHFYQGGCFLFKDDETHRKKITNVIKKSKAQRLVLRGEAMVSNQDYDHINDLHQSPLDKQPQMDTVSGEGELVKQYSCPRQFITSNVVRKEARNDYFKYIAIICYEVVNHAEIDETLDIESQFEMLSRLGFQTPQHEIFSIRELTYVEKRGSPKTDEDKLRVSKEEQVAEKDAIYLADLLQKLTVKFCVEGDEQHYTLGGTTIKSFTCDGIVVSTLLPYVREEDKKPSYAFAFKSSDLQEMKETTVRDIIWKQGKTGAKTPVLVYDTVLLSGKQLSQTSLFNKKKLEDMKIGVGSRIVVTLQGLANPQVVRVITESDDIRYDDTIDQEEILASQVVQMMRNFAIKGWDVKTIREVIIAANDYYANLGQECDILETVPQVLDFSLSTDLDEVKIPAMAETRKKALLGACEKIQELALKDRKKKTSKKEESNEAYKRTPMENICQFLCSIVQSNQITLKFLTQVFTSESPCDQAYIIYLLVKDKKYRDVDMNIFVREGIKQGKLQYLSDWIEKLTVSVKEDAWTIKAFERLAEISSEEQQEGAAQILNKMKAQEPGTKKSSRGTARNNTGDALFVMAGKTRQQQGRADRMRAYYEALGYRESRSLTSTVTLIVCADLSLLAASTKLDSIKKSNLQVVVHDREKVTIDAIDAIDGINIEYFADTHGAIIIEDKKASKGGKVSEQDKKSIEKTICKVMKIKTGKAPKKPVVKMHVESVSDSEEEPNDRHHEEPEELEECESDE